MENKLKNPENLKKIFESLPQIDPRIEDLRAINYEILVSIVAQVELKAYLQGGIGALQDADKLFADASAKISLGS
jgi:imidazole glycerol phosphate synthase subunit HisF